MDAKYSYHGLLKIYDCIVPGVHTLPQLTKTMGWRCIAMANKKNKNTGAMSDEQAVRKKLSTEFDHEFANEPLTATERYNNKKTKKRQ